MGCPAEAYQLIMEKRKWNNAAIKIKETTKKRCRGEENEEKRTETAIIAKGDWEHIQEAVQKEFEMQTETEHQCEDCKEKGESKSGKKQEKS